MIKDFLKLNRWDLNFILTMVGFPFFTILISDSIASIAYRGGALLIALMCVKRTGLKFVPAATVRNFLIVLLYVSLQAIIGIFYGKYANYPYTGIKYTFLLFNVGILWVPLMAFVCGFNRIQWNKTLFIIFILLLITIVHADLRTYVVDVSSSGRFDMGRLSTLAFGDNAGYLVLMAVTLLVTRTTWLVKKRTLVIGVLVIAILAGLFGILKAGSRGPLVGCVCGCIFLAYCMNKKDRLVLILSSVTLIMSGFQCLKLKVLHLPCISDLLTRLRMEI